MQMMNANEVETLNLLLNKAEKELVDNINSRIPADSVPDRIAIPILNRLETEQANLEDMFNQVRFRLEALG